MFRRVASFLEGAAERLLCAGLLALMVLAAGPSAAVAATASGSITTTHWKSSSSEGYEVTATVNTAGLATVTLSSSRIAGGAVELLPDQETATVFSGTADLLSRPVVGESYTITVVYADGTTASETLHPTVTGVADSFPLATAPLGGVAATSTPTFTWTAPTAAPANGYLLYLTGSDVPEWILSVPPTQTSAQYSSDGTLPSVLSPAVVYDWSVAALDANDNAAEYRSAFMLGASFAGRATDLKGAGVAGASIYVFDSTGGMLDKVGTTLADGTYYYGGLAAGDYTVMFATDTILVYYNNRLFTPDTLHITSGQVQNGINVVLDDWGSVSGTVGFADKGVASGGMTITLCTSAKVPVSGFPTVTVLNNGKSFASYYMAAVPPGSYYLKYSAQGYLTAWNPVTVVAGLPVEFIDATLSTGIPTVKSFSAPATSATLAVSGISMTATEYNGVTGYILTESPSAPAVSDSRWSSAPPTSYTFASAGAKTLYAWAKGIAGISASKSAAIAVGPVVTLSALADGSTTTNKTVNVSGVAASSGSTITAVTVNGTSAAVKADGSFSFPVILAAPANTITVAATNAAGVKTTVSRSINYADVAPSLTAISPADNSATTASAITLTGSVGANTTVQVIVNGGAPFAASLDGTSFSAPVNLSSGMNTVEVVATDLNQVTNRMKRTVTLLSSGPNLQITTPAEDMSINSVTPVTTTIGGVTTGSAVTITVGATTYTPAVTDGVFSSPVTLPVGTDAVLVTATDLSGNSTTVQRNVVIFGKPGDCNGNGVIQLSEVQSAIYMFMGTKSVTSCVDTSGDGKVGLPEVQKIIKAYLAQ